MSGDASGKQGDPFWRASPKWLIGGAVALIVVMTAIIVTVVLVDRSHDRARRAAEIEAASGPAVTSPYDLTELPTDTDLGRIEEAAFVSVLVPNDAGKLTSYGIDSEVPTAQALSQAVQSAEKVSAEVAATLDGTSEAAGVDSTITFVFASRETLTFTLDLEHGLVGRDGQAWRPAGDLRALVAAAIAGPGR